MDHDIKVLDGLFQILFLSDLLPDISYVFIDFFDFLDCGPTVKVGPLDPEETPELIRVPFTISTYKNWEV